MKRRRSSRHSYQFRRFWIYVTKSELGTVSSYSFPGQQKGTKKIHLKSSNGILIKGLVEQELLPKMHMKY